MTQTQHDETGGADEPRSVTARITDGLALADFTLEKKIGAAFASAALVLLVGAAATLGVQQLLRAEDRVAQTERVLDRLDALLLHLQDAETERRGFIITGDSTYLEPYRVARRRIDVDTAGLRRATADDARQQHRLDALRPLVRRTVAEMDSTVHLRATAGFAAAARAERSDRGRRAADELRAAIRAMEREERAMLATRSAARRTRTLIVFLIIGIGSVVAFALAVAINRAVRRDVVEQGRVRGLLERQTAQLQGQAAQLRQRVEEAQTLAARLEQANEQLLDANAGAEQARAAAEAARRAAERDADRTARLQRVTAALSRATSVVDVSTAVFTEGIRALGADGGLLALLTADDTELEVVGATDYPRELIDRWQRFPVTASRPVAEAVRSRDLVTVTAPDEWITRYPGIAASPFAMRLPPAAAAPLLLGDRVIGGLSVTYGDGVDFDEHDREFLWALATLCAQAVDRIRLQHGERRARERAAFLSDASASLVASLDYEATLARVARSAVPALADWCSVDVLEDDGQVRQLAVAHVDPVKVEWARELRRRQPPDLSAPTGLPNVLRTGRSELYPDITDGMLAAAARDEAELRLMRDIGFTSVLIVPLASRGRTLGALTFVTAESRRHYREDDLMLAEELGRRAAAAIDNARLFREAEEARQAAETANRSKSEFLATMSHEIRTPINAIIGYAQLMELGLPGPITPQQRAQIERILASGQHLLGLINDILDLSKIEAGRLTVTRAPADARAAIEGALALVGPQAAAKEIALDAEPADAPYLGDEHRVQQILVNLLSNAVKFTNAGGRVSVRCGTATGAADAADGSSAPRWAYVAVADTGIGVPPGKLESIFQPFEQADSGYTRAQSGTGLGLTISRRLARLMGGDLTVESEEGVGSTFTLWLPRE